MKMRAIADLSALLIVAAVSSCAPRAHISTALATATPSSLLIESRGVPMSLGQAMRAVRFRPYLPPAPILAFAVIPPLGGADTPAHRGVAIEYATHGHHLLLSQWPRQRFRLAIGMTNITHHPCTIVHYSTTNVMWTTHRNLVMTLQPDGRVRPAVIDVQARHLLASGACR